MEYKYFNLEQDPKMKGLDNYLMLLLDKARGFAGIPFKITSGVRDLYSNKQVNGIKDSSHLKGLAADILCENSTQRFFIEKGAYMAGFRRIGKGDNHVHLDIDPEKPQDISFIENH
jgi:uncharacterized protein YcbK (DUF882 family)